MSIFESGVRDGRKVELRVVSGNAGPKSMGRRVAIARRTDLSRGPLAETALAFARLFFPVLLLVTAGAAALIYGNQPAHWFGYADVDGRPFVSGLVALPLTFLIVQLTNRRYGAAYALAQVMGAVLAAIGVALYASHELVFMRGSPLPAMRVVVGFGTGLVVAQMISIFAFDRLRGPNWWQAPLVSSLLGGAALAFIAYPVAYFGTGLDWFGPMTSYLGLAGMASVLMLAPYWLLRPVIAPIAGFGGY